jgi:hypothetical protein
VSSQWVDASGSRWRFYAPTKSWQKRIAGAWVDTRLPTEGLKKTEVVPPDQIEVGDQWVDADNTPWRYHVPTSAWQKKVAGGWIPATLPPEGLRKVVSPARPVIRVVETMGPTGPPGSSSSVVEMLPPERFNGVTTTFMLGNNADLAQAFQVFRNGLLEVHGVGYTVTPSRVVFTTPPLNDDVVTVIYQKAQ